MGVIRMDTRTLSCPGDFVIHLRRSPRNTMVKHLAIFCNIVCPSPSSYGEPSIPKKPRSPSDCFCSDGPLDPSPLFPSPSSPLLRSFEGSHSANSSMDICLLILGWAPDGPPAFSSVSLWASSWGGPPLLAVAGVAAGVYAPNCEASLSGSSCMSWDSSSAMPGRFVEKGVAGVSSPRRDDLAGTKP